MRKFLFAFYLLLPNCGTSMVCYSLQNGIVDRQGILTRARPPKLLDSFGLLFYRNGSSIVNTVPIHCGYQGLIHPSPQRKHPHHRQTTFIDFHLVFWTFLNYHHFGTMYNQSPSRLDANVAFSHHFIIFFNSGIPPSPQSMHFYLASLNSNSTFIFFSLLVVLLYCVTKKN